MRIAFKLAQINVTRDSRENVARIKSLLAQGPEPGADITYLVTPECGITGHWEGWHTQQPLTRIQELEHSVRESGVALVTGTMLPLPTRNAVVIITPSQGWCYTHAKTLLDGLDLHLGCEPPQEYVPYECAVTGVRMATTICNDFWGNSMSGVTSLPLAWVDGSAPDCFLQLVNGQRAVGEPNDTIYWDWHSSHLRMTSRHCMITVISVDAANQWDGTPCESQCSSPSGVWRNGHTLLELAAQGECVATHTFTVDELRNDPWHELDPHER